MQTSLIGQRSINAIEPNGPSKEKRGILCKEERMGPRTSLSREELTHNVTREVGVSLRKGLRPSEDAPCPVVPWEPQNLE